MKRTTRRAFLWAGAVVVALGLLAGCAGTPLLPPPGADPRAAAMVEQQCRMHAQQVYPLFRTSLGDALLARQLMGECLRSQGWR